MNFQQIREPLPVATPNSRRTALVVTAICWVMVVLDGYDLISYGTVLPALLRTPGLGFDPASAGLVGSAAFLGAMFGALGSGWLGDRVGRRPVALGCVLWFSVFTFLCAFSIGPWSMGLLRMIAGVGLGGIVPVASALTMEYANPRQRTLSYTLMLSGVPIGGVISALVGLPVLSHLSWHWMFGFAAVPALIALPIIWRWLPESIDHLVSRGRQDDAAALAASLGMAVPGQDPAVVAETGLFRPGYRTASILLALATFFGLLAWFGLGTWLPGIMSRSGYDVGSSVMFLLVLNLGAVAGSMIIAVATDRWGGKLVLIPTYLIMAGALVLLVNKLEQPLLLTAIAVAGVGGHGGQILINAFVGRSYPASHRARALGWTLGAGRTGTILGPALVGWLVAGHPGWVGFVVFAIAALWCAALVAAVPRTPALAARDDH